jgi:hypothetical protein
LICAALVVLAGAIQLPPAAQTQGGQPQDVRALLQAVSKNIGADNLTTLEYNGAGMVAAPGQGYDPIPTLIGIPESWPRFAVSNYTMTIECEHAGHACASQRPRSVTGGVYQHPICKRVDSGDKRALGSRFDRFEVLRRGGTRAHSTLHRRNRRRHVSAAWKDSGGPASG